MRIEQGTTRIVIIFRKFVIKIAKIQPLKAFGIALMWKKVNHLWRHLITRNYNYHDSMYYYLIGGIMHNWHELMFYRKHYSLFLVPTYFSFLGLVNIQRAGGKIEIEIENLKYQLLDLTDEEIYDDTHHFCKPENFTKNSGHLQIFDYGNLRSQGVLKKYGDKIYNEFDFSYTKEQYYEKYC